MSDGGRSFRTAITLGAAWLVAAAFALAGSLKLADPAAFAIDIEHYRLLPPLVAAGIALYLPWFEIALAVGLCVPRLRPAARLLGLALLGVFCLALVAALARGLDIRCGCFGGKDGGASAGQALARNLVLITLLAVARGPARPERPGAA